MYRRPNAGRAELIIASLDLGFDGMRWKRRQAGKEAKRHERLFVVRLLYKIDQLLLGVYAKLAIHSVNVRLDGRIGYT